jgi:hypothetical protein
MRKINWFKYKVLFVCVFVLWGLGLVMHTANYAQSTHDVAHTTQNGDIVAGAQGDAPTAALSETSYVLTLIDKGGVVGLLIAIVVFLWRDRRIALHNIEISLAGVEKSSIDEKDIKDIVAKETEHISDSIKQLVAVLQESNKRIEAITDQNSKIITTLLDKCIPRVESDK